MTKIYSENFSPKHQTHTYKGRCRYFYSVEVRSLDMVGMMTDDIYLTKNLNRCSSIRDKGHVKHVSKEANITGYCKNINCLVVNI